MGKIVILQNIVFYLEGLVFILFEKEYFGFKEDAQLYVSKIYDFIDNDHVNFQHKESPMQLKRHGAAYTFYKANNHTTWYIFFEKRAENYLVTYITKQRGSVFIKSLPLQVQ